MSRSRVRWLNIPSPDGRVELHAFEQNTMTYAFSSLCGLYERRKGALLDDLGRCAVCQEKAEERRCGD